MRAIIVKDGELLCVKLKPYRTAISDEFWCTVGGGVDPGEALIPALVREVTEETGVTPVVGRLLYVQQYIHAELDHLEFFFQVTNSEDFTSIDLSKTTHGVEEIAEIGFVDTASEVVLPAFLQTETFDNLDSDLYPKIFNYL